jgi:RHS repeat-associated protein
MKTKLTLALVAIITGSAFAAIPAVLPEFKNEKQLAEWRAEMAVKNAATTTASVDHAFYTGKPYIETTGSYAFKYRSYNPELARWTSEDPSGFPDGANNTIYSPTPTCDFDLEGLLKWSTLRNTNTSALWTHQAGELISDVWEVETNDGSAIITLWKNTRLQSGGSLAGYIYEYNCFGYAFGNSQYWIPGNTDAILKGDGYRLITGPDKTGARIAYWDTDVHAALVNEVSTSGIVTKVTGKIGNYFNLTSTPAGQGYGPNVQYYE